LRLIKGKLTPLIHFKVENYGRMMWYVGNSDKPLKNPVVAKFANTAAKV
jgi:hypothetical protein